MKRKNLILHKDTIANLTIRQIRRAKGGAITDMDTMLSCYTEQQCGGTDNFLCASVEVCETDFASCATNYAGCNSGDLICV